jgi:hypothetical protein
MLLAIGLDVEDNQLRQQEMFARLPYFAQPITGESPIPRRLGAVTAGTSDL